MKTLLFGIAVAIGMVVASQAFAAPSHCANGIWQNGHYVCFEE